MRQDQMEGDDVARMMVAPAVFDSEGAGSEEARFEWEWATVVVESRRKREIESGPPPLVWNGSEEKQLSQHSIVSFRRYGSSSKFVAMSNVCRCLIGHVMTGALAVVTPRSTIHRSA